MLWKWSFCVPIFLRRGWSRRVSKSMPATCVWPIEDVLTTRACRSGELDAPESSTGMSSCVK